MPNKRILVCDDEEAVRESLKLILDDAGFDTVLASNGMECCKLAEKNNGFDLVILDIKMPQESGLDTLVKIKQQNPDAKIIIATGYRSTDVAQEAVKRGASDYIVKPFEPADIVNKINTILM